MRVKSIHPLYQRCEIILTEISSFPLQKEKEASNQKQTITTIGFIHRLSSPLQDARQILEGILSHLINQRPPVKLVV